jgi:hypothetical protein
LKETDVSKEHAVSIFAVEANIKQEISMKQIARRADLDLSLCFLSSTLKIEEIYYRETYVGFQRYTAVGKQSRP